MRLRRLEEVFERHPIYFVTACTHERHKLLADRQVQASLDVFGANGPERGAWLGAYVLMPDHLHCFVALDDERTNLPAWVKSLKNTLSKCLRGIGTPAPHWQKGFFDHIIRGGESYRQK